MSVFICSKLSSIQSKEMVQIELPDNRNTSTTTVETLFKLVSSKLDLEQSGQEFELVCFGKSLKPDRTLASYGIKSGTIVYVFKKRVLSVASASPQASGVTKFSHLEINNMLLALKTAIRHPNFRTMLKKLQDKDFRDNLMDVTPGLRDDPIALAILQDIELLSAYTDPQNISIYKVLEEHPSLGDAITFLAAAFHEEQASSSAGPSSGSHTAVHGYSLDNYSDEEDDMDDSTPEEQAAARRAQIAAIAARRRDLATRAARRSVPATGALITSEMLASALSSLDQPSASSAPAANTRPTQAPTAPVAPAMQTGTTPRDWSSQIQQIREITPTADDDLCRNALEATNGDVHAALNIILASNFD